METSSHFQSLRDSLKDMESTVSSLNRRSAVQAYGHFSDTAARDAPLDVDFSPLPASGTWPQWSPAAPASSSDVYSGPSANYLALNQDPSQDPDFDRTLSSVVERVRRSALEASVAVNTLADHYSYGSGGNTGEDRPQARPWKPPGGPVSPARNPYTYTGTKRPPARRLDVAPNGLGLGLGPQNVNMSHLGLDFPQMPSVDSTVNYSIADAMNMSYTPLASTVLNPAYLRGAYQPAPKN